MPPPLAVPEGLLEVQNRAMNISIKYVFSEPKTGRLFYRRQFPPHLRELIPGKPQGIKRSLGAKDLSGPDAARRLTDARAEYERLASQAQKAATGTYDPLDPPMVGYLAARFAYETLLDDERHRKGLSVPPRSYAHRTDPESDYVESREMRWGRHGEVHMPDDPQGFDRQGIIDYWGPWTRDYTVALGHTFDPASEQFGNLCEAIADAACGAWLELDRRRDGSPSPTPEPPEAPRIATATRSGSSLPLLTLYDDYAIANRISPVVRYECRNIIDHLIARIGHDDARRLTTTEVRDWRDAVALELTNRGKLRDPRTVRKYVGTLKTLLGWAVEEQRLGANAAAPVKVKVPIKVKLRDRAFTLPEARTILSATLQPAPVRMSSGHRSARRWVPWLCAYSGARVGEMAQLRKEDVGEVEGVWTMKITPEAGTVKSKEARLVPLHAHLIDLGFLAFVAAAPDGPLFFDPAAVRKSGESNRHVKKVGERLALWVRKDLGISDTGVAPNHGWRHLFKWLATDNGVEGRVADAIAGHAFDTEGKKYGSVSVRAKAVAIAMLPRFEIEQEAANP